MGSWGGVRGNGLCSTLEHNEEIMDLGVQLRPYGKSALSSGVGSSLEHDEGIMDLDVQPDQSGRSSETRTTGMGPIWKGLEYAVGGLDDHAEGGGQIGYAISDGAQRVATGDKAISPLYTESFLTAALPHATPFAPRNEDDLACLPRVPSWTRAAWQD